MRHAGLVTLWLVLVLTLSLLAACGVDTPEAHTFELEIRERSLAPQTLLLQVKQDDRVTIVVNADEHLVFHLHGYDIEREAEPGAPATLEFTAHATGSFPFTIHAAADDHEAEPDHDDDHENGHGSEKEETEMGRLEVRPR